jgi:hypothetical protein
MPEEDAAAKRQSEGSVAPTPRRGERWRIAACLGIYALASIVMGREVLAQLSTSIANDAGDPLLTTAILHWVATHLPYTDAWYQLPTFFPTRDTLTFSEHLLGIAVVAAPIEWLTGSPVVAYNLTLVASFALSAAAMFALAYRLTGSVAAAFIGGLAYGFAPYRISQLPHIQMEVLWYAPLALLGLHAYLATGRARWLVLYGTAWMLQGAANGYALVYLSVLIGLWGLWFVVLPGRWKDLAAIVVATIVAVLPLAPILLRYIQVHDYYGMVRGLEEIRSFSADISAILCAPPALAFWGWVRVGCRPEGELFPGIAVFAMFVAAAVSILRSGPPAAPPPKPIRIVIRILLAVATVYAAIAVSVWFLGPWTYEIGPLRASASSIAKPVLVSICSAVMALALPPGTRLAARRASTLSFYVLGTIAMWLLSLGPRMRVMDRAIGYNGPYTWIMLLPGGDGLRVPARFWMVAILCLAVVVAVFVADVLRRRPRHVRVVVPLLAVLVLADGWSWAIPAQPLPSGVPNPAALAGRTVLDLPAGDYPDISAQYRAIRGGWRSVNGYSGFVPPYYPLVIDASRDNLVGILDAFQPLGELDVVVARDASDQQSVMRQQPGVTITGENGAFTQFRLPARREPERDGRVRLPIASLTSRCEAPALKQALDRDLSTYWVCGPELDEQQLTIDLGQVGTAGAVLHDEGPVAGNFPRRLVIETSVDGSSWSPAWSGNAWGPAISAAMRDPKANHIWFVFEPRAARFIRMTHPMEPQHYIWAIADLEVWSR